VLGTVRDCDFTDARSAATWRAVGYLADHDAPIDEITVAWQTMRVRSRSGDGLTVPELRAMREATLFHEVGAATLARSTLIRVADQAQLAISRCADDLRLDPAPLIDSVATHHVAVAAAAQRLTGEHLANAPFSEVKKRLLARAKAITRAIRHGRTTGQRASSYSVDPRRSHISSWVVGAPHRPEARPVTGRCTVDKIRPDIAELSAFGRWVRFHLRACLCTPSPSMTSPSGLVAGDPKAPFALSRMAFLGRAGSTSWPSSTSRRVRIADRGSRQTVTARSGGRDVAGDVTVLAVYAGDDGVGRTGNGGAEDWSQPEEPQLAGCAVAVEEGHSG
jgi:hypothetical protein